jgi:hypothetical protein
MCRTTGKLHLQDPATLLEGLSRYRPRADIYVYIYIYMYIYLEIYIYTIYKRPYVCICMYTHTHTNTNTHTHTHTNDLNSSRRSARAAVARVSASFSDLSYSALKLDPITARGKARIRIPIFKLVYSLV